MSEEELRVALMLSTQSTSASPTAAASAAVSPAKSLLSALQHIPSQTNPTDIDNNAKGLFGRSVSALSLLTSSTSSSSLSTASMASAPESIGRSSSLGLTPISSPLATPDSPTSSSSSSSTAQPSTILAELEKAAMQAMKRPAALGPKKHSSDSAGSGLMSKSRSYASWTDPERDEIVRALLGIALQNPDVKWHGGRRQDLVAIGSTMRTKSRSQCRDFYYRCLKQITKLLASSGIKVDLATDCDLARAAIVFYLQHYRIANEGTETRHLTFSARNQAMRYLNNSLSRAVGKYMDLSKEKRREMLVTACVEHLRKQAPSSSM